MTLVIPNNVYKNWNHFGMSISVDKPRLSNKLNCNRDYGGNGSKNISNGLFKELYIISGKCFTYYSLHNPHSAFEHTWKL